MAPKVAKAKIAFKATKVSKVKKSKASGHSNAKKDNSEIEEASIFQRFTADKPLKDGLCMLRDLGNGKNEIIYLNYLSRDQLSTERARNELQSSLKRSAQFASYGWQSMVAGEMCRLAVRVATKDIFPFQKLPPELRCKIYEIVLVSPYRIQRVEVPKYRQRQVRVGHKIYLRTKSPYFTAFNFLLTCRQFYDEGMKFFWLNNFRVHDASLFTPRRHISFAKNVQHLTFDWRGFAMDEKSFAAFKKFPQLKVLNVIFTHDVYNREEGPSYVNRNKKFQNDQRVQSFCQAHGFDALLELRNLELITLTLTWMWEDRPLPQAPKETEASEDEEGIGEDEEDVGEDDEEDDETDEKEELAGPTPTEVFEEFLKGIVTKQKNTGNVTKQQCDQ